MPRNPDRPTSHHSRCMVCSRRVAVGLFRDEQGWHLLACSDRRCVAPLGCIPFDYVMDLADFLACRRMIQANRLKAMSGEYGSGQGVRFLGSAVEQRRKMRHENSSSP